jgi:hypothetical protein
VIADFPIEWFLMNEYSNYVGNREVGKQAHSARIFLESLLDRVVADKQKLIDYYEALCAIGQGRQLVGFFRKR